MSPKDMTSPEVEHLAIMAYATHFQWVTPRPPLADMVAVHLQSTSGRVAEPSYFRIEVLAKDVDPSKMKVYVVAPHDKGVATLIKLNQHGEGSFIPDIYGMHEILIEIGDDRLGGHFFRVMPRLIQVKPPGMAPCALGSLVEVLVNATGAPRSEDILVTAYSPSGRPLKCPLKKVDEGHSAIFKPDEAGIWEIAITYQGNHIQGSPYTCSVFDPSGVSVHGLDGAMPFKAHAFEIDARGVGVSGELHVDIVCEKRSVVCAVEKLLENKFRITFMPRQNGKHRVYVYFNGYDVRGSPFIMRVGTKGRSGKTRSSPSHESARYRSESPSMHFNTSMLKNEHVRRELYSPQNARKSGSYSPQLSPTYNEERDEVKSKPQLSPSYGEDRYEIKTSKQIYSSPRLKSPSPTRLGSPGRDLYSPKLVDDQQQHGYSTVFKSEFRKEIRKSQSPSLDYGSRDATDTYSRKIDYGSRDAADTYSRKIDYGSRDATDTYTRKNVSKTNLTKDEGLYSTSYYSKLKNDSTYGRKSDSPTLMSSPINVSSF